MSCCASCSKNLPCEAGCSTVGGSFLDWMNTPWSEHLGTADPPEAVKELYEGPEITLTAGVYRATVAGGLTEWDKYRAYLKKRFGKGSFTTLQTKQNTKEKATWVVFQVITRIQILPTVMGHPAFWKVGDTPETTGSWPQPSPSWENALFQADISVKKAVDSVVKAASAPVNALVWGGVAIVLFQVYRSSRKTRKRIT